MALDPRSVLWINYELRSCHIRHLSGFWAEVLLLFEFRTAHDTRGSISIGDSFLIQDAQKYIRHLATP